MDQLPYPPNPTSTTDSPGEESLRPWDQLPQETDLWYERFIRYMLMGPSRSVPKVAAIFGASPNALSSWFAKAKDNHWHDRARKWDQEEYRKDKEAQQQAREAARDKRIKLLDKLYTKLDQALDSLDDDPLRWQHVAPALRAVVGELRAEFEPERDTQGVEVTVTADATQLLRARIMRIREAASEAEDAAPPVSGGESVGGADGSE